MWGSDWPVALTASDYGRWLASARSMVATLSETERNAVLGENAVRFYALSIA
jgi:L-fuconolactonase